MEFVEAMKKFSKICKGDGRNHTVRCNNECPLKSMNFCTKPPHKYDEKDIIEAEKIISEWKPPVDWSKVKVDTPILVWDNSEYTCKRKRYFAKYVDGKVYAWNRGATSWSTIGDMTGWEYAELAEVDDGRE